MNVKALKSFATKYGCATKGHVITVKEAAGKELIKLKYAEKTDETPKTPVSPVPPLPSAPGSDAE